MFWLLRKLFNRLDGAKRLIWDLKDSYGEISNMLVTKIIIVMIGCAGIKS